MRTPSPPYCMLDVTPPFGRLVHRRGSPIDYGPVLLLMPFGFHLAMDTLPSGELQVAGFRSALACLRLSPSCPFRLLHTFLSPGPRGITPAFGYGAPHSNARGTLTLPINALLSAHYGPGRPRLVFPRFPGCPGYTIYLAHRFPGGTRTVHQLLSMPCHRAAPTTPPK